MIIIVTHTLLARQITGKNDITAVLTNRVVKLVAVAVYDAPSYLEITIHQRAQRVITLSLTIVIHRIMG